MKKCIFAEKDCWLTQTVLKEHEFRMFHKFVFTKNPDEWVNWSNEQRDQYFKEHLFHK